MTGHWILSFFLPITVGGSSAFNLRKLAVYLTSHAPVFGSCPTPYLTNLSQVIVAFIHLVLEVLMTEVGMCQLYKLESQKGWKWW